MKPLVLSPSAFLIGILMLLVFMMPHNANAAPCSRYLSGVPAPSPYGLAWNWLSSAKELLLSSNCEGAVTTVTIGSPNTGIPTGGAGLVYSWGKVYAYYNNSWNVNQPVPLTCNGTKIPVADATPTDAFPDYWCNGTLTGALPANAPFFVGYTCIYGTSGWKCGCSDASCARNYWQLQGVVPVEQGDANTIACVVDTTVTGSTHFVSPNGNGSCSAESPCSLATGLNRAQPGDAVVLKDGTYSSRIKTVRHGTNGNPILIRAENRHRAILEYTAGSVIDIEHDYITVQGIKADNKRVSGKGTSLVNIVGEPGNPVINNITVEDTWLVDGGNAGIIVQDAETIVIRHNLIEHTGYGADHVGEGLYLGSSLGSGVAPINNVEIYGNTFRDIVSNFIDYKHQVRNVNVHHNVFEDHKMSEEHGIANHNNGLVVSAGDDRASGNKFQDNIVRNSASLAGIIALRGNRVDILNNVFSNITGGALISVDSGADIISGNTFCNTPTNRRSTTHTFTNNQVGAPLSACQAVEQRIRNEMQTLCSAGD